MDSDGGNQTDAVQDDHNNVNGSSYCSMPLKVQHSIGLSICLLGISGNLAFMFVVSRVPSMRIIPNAYLVNLAIADLLHLFIHGLFWFAFLSGIQIAATGPLPCSLMMLTRVSQYVSMFTVTVLSIERFMALCRPLIYRDGIIHKKTFVAIMIVSLWFASAAITVEAFVDCVALIGDRLLIGQVFFITMVFTLMLVVLIIYILIIKQVRTSSRAVRNKEKQIVRVCLATALVYFLCMLPTVLHAVIIVIQSRHPSIVLTGFDDNCSNNVSIFFLEINSSVNPLIYTVMSSTYRKAFHKAFSCLCVIPGVCGPKGATRISQGETTNMALETSLSCRETKQTHL